MAKLSKLPSIAGLAVAGAALGLYLGSSAISEINPAYYSTPLSASAFHADLVPNASAQGGEQSLPQLAEEVVSDIGRGCSWCGGEPVEYVSIDYSAFDSYAAPPSSYRSPPADLVLAEADERVSRALSMAELRDVERYAHFPVSRDEERPAAAAAEGASEPDSGDCTASGACEGEATPGI